VTDFTVRELAENPGLAADAIRRKGYSNVYIHIDLDALDPTEFWLTPLEEPGGMTKENLLEVLRRIREAANVVGFGILEYAALRRTGTTHSSRNWRSMGWNCSSVVQ